MGSPVCTHTVTSVMRFYKSYAQLGIKKHRLSGVSFLLEVAV